MDLELWKKVKKEKKLTISAIAQLANLPKGSVQNIFCGYVPNPRTDTVEAIEKALGLQNEKAPLQLSNGEQKLIELFRLVPQDQQDLVLSMINGAIESLNNN